MICEGDVPQMYQLRHLNVCRWVGVFQLPQPLSRAVGLEARVGIEPAYTALQAAA
jgi:hypothetical protein